MTRTNYPESKTAIITDVVVSLEDIGYEERQIALASSCYISCGIADIFFLDKPLPTDPDPVPGGIGHRILALTGFDLTPYQIDPQLQVHKIRDLRWLRFCNASPATPSTCTFTLYSTQREV